jgi:hypothetical protein
MWNCPFGLRQNYKVIKFQSWILLPSSGNKEGRGQQVYLPGPLFQLASREDQNNHRPEQIRFLSSFRFSTPHRKQIPAYKTL